MIELCSLTKIYDGRSAVAGLDLCVATGELLVLVGPSGCGKTTTLTMINRLTEPTSGDIRIDGKSVRDFDPVALRRRTGFVFQDVGLFPHLTASENVGIALKLTHTAKPEIDKRVGEVMRRMRMPVEEFGGRFPVTLSAGQRQRIGIARALAGRPSIMLMDEPSGALDPLTRDELVEEYRTIHEALQLTTLLVTHDMTEAFLVADRIAIMRHGALVQVGTPHEIAAAPADAFVGAMVDHPRRRASELAKLLSASGA
jgi:osmoprotectant transport system ATP-binding protein